MSYESFILYVSWKLKHTLRFSFTKIYLKNWLFLSIWHKLSENWSVKTIFLSFDYLFEVDDKKMNVFSFISMETIFKFLVQDFDNNLWWMPNVQWESHWIWYLPEYARIFMINDLVRNIDILLQSIHFKDSRNVQR